MGKRIFDFFGALALLIIVAPIAPFIVVWIKTTSSGPVIFRQTRIGYRGKPFVVFKFRTLADKSGRPLDMVMPGDSRVTVPGRFLRKTHLDELPQLINVLLGQMSLVGPRPYPSEEVEKYTRLFPECRHRLDVRPGITGLPQLYGRAWLIKKGMRRMVRLDLFYVNHQGLCFDLLILIKTIGTVLRCKGI